VCVCVCVLDLVHEGVSVMYNHEYALCLPHA